MVTVQKPVRNATLINLELIGQYRNRRSGSGRHVVRLDIDAVIRLVPLFEGRESLFDVYAGVDLPELSRVSFEEIVVGAVFELPMFVNADWMA